MSITAAHWIAFVDLRRCCSLFLAEPRTSIFGWSLLPNLERGQHRAEFCLGLFCSSTCPHPLATHTPRFGKAWIVFRRIVIRVPSWKKTTTASPPAQWFLVCRNCAAEVVVRSESKDWGNRKANHALQFTVAYKTLTLSVLTKRAIFRTCASKSSFKSSKKRIKTPGSRLRLYHDSKCIK